MINRKPPASNNPYIFAAAVLADRILWDLKPSSWTSRARLEKLRSHYIGQKAVILCNGPSLNRVDFDRLTNVYTFGLNKINLLFDRSRFRPSCIVAVNDLVIDQNREFFNKSDIPLFLSHRAAAHIRLRDNVTLLHSTQWKRFAKDCSVSIYEGATVTFVAMQLAYHMGFREIALVGCDHNFKASGPARQVEIAEAEDADHFDPRYFSGGQPWQLPDLLESEFAYGLAGRAFEASGGIIINCTDGGRLELFQRMTLTEFLVKAPEQKGRV